MKREGVEIVEKELIASPKAWLVTGVAGFIGSNILERLLKLGQSVVGLDNYETGFKHNLDSVKQSVEDVAWHRFRFIEGDIRSLECCREACKGMDYVLHQAALGSVPRSVKDPIASNAVNVSGFLNMLVAARDANVKRFVYAASSSTYGDHPALPKVEEKTGKPLSPYAVTKLVNELYADVFANTYGLECVGLRYFNVFGRRQDPDGAYAAVIPTWTAAMLRNDVIYINGDGETSRDFCFIDNAVQANILAARAEVDRHEVCNIAVGDRTTLNELFGLIRESLSNSGIHYDRRPVYRDFRKGDVRHSQADISRAIRNLGYQPTHDIRTGIRAAVLWYLESINNDHGVE